MEEKNIRVRFAPSPTGPLHIGGVRTALYNYLFAKKHGGEFVLRIEDTDQNRFVHGTEEYIMESLSWCGITFDEGIAEGGKHGPYRQSQRKDLYYRFAIELVKKGFAYYAFDTPAELEDLRKKLEDEKASNTSYSSFVRMGMVNSLTLDEEELRKKLDSGDPYVIRFKMPVDTEIEAEDIVRGKVVVNTSTLDDKVLFKSDGMPTYHLANVVDDHLMEISHVIRGEEWLPSLPLHLMLYRGFEWEKPVFAHLPLLLRPDGKGKLSKRDGDKLGFPVFPINWKNPSDGDIYQGFRENGYFPEAFINMLAMLGWNPGTEQEFFSMDELISQFSLDRVVKSGARFDIEKAKNFNQHYLRLKSDEELAGLFMPVLEEKGVEANTGYIQKVCGLVKERVAFIEDFWDQSFFFFTAPQNYDPKAVKKRWKEDSPVLMQELQVILKEEDDFDSETLEKTVKEWIADKEYNMGSVMNAFRLSIVGALKGPHLFDIISMIGKKETLARIIRAIVDLRI